MQHALPAHKTILIDAFAGAGGNAIAFAMTGRWERIFAIEKDPEVLKCAKHNAEVHEVANKIWFIQGDCFEIIKTRFSEFPENTVIFASPPWGGKHPPIKICIGNQLPNSHCRPYLRR